MSEVNKPKGEQNDEPSPSVSQSKTTPQAGTKYIVDVRRPHWWLMGLTAVSAYVLWTGDGVPLIPDFQALSKQQPAQAQKDGYGSGSGGSTIGGAELVESVAGNEDTGAASEWTESRDSKLMPRNIFLTCSRTVCDVAAHGMPEGLHWQHQHTVQGAMACGNECACGTTCSCGHSLSIVEDPFSTSEYLLAYALFGLPFSSVLGLLGRRSRLVMTREGVSFAFGMMSSWRRPRTKAWSDISSVAFSPQTADLDPEDRTVSGVVEFALTAGQIARLKLKSLRPRDYKALHEALEQFAEPGTVDAELIQALKNHLAGQVSASGAGTEEGSTPDLSFTAMWEKDLGAHMGATTFVPLTRGSTLQSGRIKIVALLASGGLSAVYLAERPGGALVILKESVVPKHVDDRAREKARELFEREARLLLKLNHPQIARVVDHIVEGGRDYLVLEYIAGQSLRQFVKRSGAQEEQVVARWLAEIATILKYLHGLDPPVIHRDLTPDNIVLRDDGSLALIDFGAANEYVGAATGTLIGKQSYISPEQFRGRSSPLSDLYALGCTAHFLLTANDPEALSVSHPRVERSEISEAIDALVAQMTALEEKERVQSAEQLLSLLEPHLSRGAEEHSSQCGEDRRGDENFGATAES